LSRSHNCSFCLVMRIISCKSQQYLVCKGLRICSEERAKIAGTFDQALENIRTRSNLVFPCKKKQNYVPGLVIRLPRRSLCRKLPLGDFVFNKRKLRPPKFVLLLFCRVKGFGKLLINFWIFMFMKMLFFLCFFFKKLNMR
jgi:hypothetical protein